MPHRPLRRPLATALLLSLVDYALWNWSVGAGHDGIALAAGLTLIPLLIALAGLLLLGAGRLVGQALQRLRTSASPDAGESLLRTVAGPGAARGSQTVADGGDVGNERTAAAPASKLAA